MSGLKDWSKVFVVALLTAMATQIMARIFIKSDKIDNAVTQTELTEAKKEVIDYTDTRIDEHEKIHDQINVQYTQIQSDLTIIKAHLINK
jgi:F0F1-type ATP synthase epsilon subunit